MQVSEQHLSRAEDWIHARCHAAAVPGCSCTQALPLGLQSALCWGQRRTWHSREQSAEGRTRAVAEPLAAIASTQCHVL